MLYELERFAARDPRGFVDVVPEVHERYLDRVQRAIVNVVAFCETRPGRLVHFRVEAQLSFRRGDRLAVVCSDGLRCCSRCGLRRGTGLHGCTVAGGRFEAIPFEIR